MKKEQPKYMTGRAERFNYSFYFLGQNVCFAVISMFLQQYALDMGVSALIFAGVALAIRGWDAINDTIFGIIMEKVHLKGGKYLPWIRLSIFLIPLTTVLLFAIPSGLSVGVKIVWIVVAYVLWDTAYTIGDVPLYAMSTAMTSIQQERTLLISRGRFFQYSGIPDSCAGSAYVPCAAGRMGIHRSYSFYLQCRHDDSHWI